MRETAKEILKRHAGSSTDSFTDPRLIEAMEEYAIGFLNYSMHRTGVNDADSIARIKKMLEGYNQWLDENGIL